MQSLKWILAKLGSLALVCFPTQAFGQSEFSTPQNDEFSSSSTSSSESSPGFRIEGRVDAPGLGSFPKPEPKEKVQSLLQDFDVDENEDWIRAPGLWLAGSPVDEEIDVEAIFEDLFEDQAASHGERRQE